MKFLLLKYTFDNKSKMLGYHCSLKMLVFNDDNVAL